MSRSRGDISNTHLNHDYPYQVALRYDLCTGTNYGDPQRLAGLLGAYWRQRHASDGEECFLVFCFNEAEDARQFKETFDGVPFYPEDLKGKLWRRPPGDVRRTRKPTKRELIRQWFNPSG